MLRRWHEFLSAHIHSTRNKRALPIRVGVDESTQTATFNVPQALEAEVRVIMEYTGTSARKQRPVRDDYVQGGKKRARYSIENSGAQNPELG